MDFDHRDGEAKSRDIGNMAAGGAALATIMKEISKCDLVCANCHRVRTWTRRRQAAAVARQRDPESQRALFEMHP